MCRINIGILYLLFVVLFVNVSCSKKEKRRVLVVHSYEESYTAYKEFNKLIIKAFHEHNVDVDLRIIYLDCESYREKEEIKRMSLLLDSISRNWKPDIILVNEDQATYSLLKSNNPLVKRIPIVFGGVNYPNWKLIAQSQNVTGFWDKIDILANIKVAKDLLGPKTDIFTLLDSTYLDRQIRDDIKKQVKGNKVTGFIDDPIISDKEKIRLKNEENYTFFRDLPVRRKSATSPSQFIWLLSKYTKNQCYIQLKRDFTTINIGNICASPSITAINEAFGQGENLLGGYMTTLPIQINEEVLTAIKILNGTKPSAIPISESKKEYIVDWNVMVKLGIPKSQVPNNYHIINIPLWEEYPTIWMVTMIIAVISFTTLFIFLLFLYLREGKRKKKALYALRNEKETLALAIEGGNTYPWILENEFFSFERAFWDTLELEARKLTVDDVISFIHPDHKAALRDWKNNHPTRKKITQVLSDFDGKGYQWWEFRYTTNKLENDKYRTAGLLLNIQHIKDRELELEEARLLAEKAELKQSFLANMSHEIRTPLNAIVGFSNILAMEEEIDYQERKEYVNTINRNSELLLKLINDILEISRIESGYMSFTYEKCLVSDLVNEVYMTHQMLIPKHLEFIKETESVPVEINVDRGRMTQVLTNFINNASKFTEKGYIKFGYHYSEKMQNIHIYVEDSGRGIPREEQKMIFSRFYKRDEFAQGAGLGLSICQVIIEKLNGKIELQSELGKGSRFTVILPCRLIKH